MTDQPTEGPTATDHDAGWADLAGRLEPLDRLVPESVPSWRPRAMGLMAVLGVLLTLVPAVLPMMFLGRLLDISAETTAHGALIGAFVAIWGALSLGVLALAARMTIGRAGRLARRDVALALAVLAVQWLWVVSLHAWNVGVAGRVELDLIARATYFWPFLVVVLVVLLGATRLADRRTALGLLLVTGVAIAFLLNETVSNALGAVADGHVSAGGLGVGAASAAQLVVLAAWWWDVGRPRVLRQ